VITLVILQEYEHCSAFQHCTQGTVGLVYTVQCLCADNSPPVAKYRAKQMPAHLHVTKFVQKVSVFQRQVTVRQHALFFFFTGDGYIYFSI
jgi:hypothetical protein